MRDLYDETKKKLELIEFLKMVKTQETYESLSSKLSHVKLSPAIMSRYVNGRVLPSGKRAEEFMKMLREAYPTETLVERNISVDERGVVDNTKIISNPSLIRLLAADCHSALDVTPDVTLTVAADGIPFAYELSMVFGTRLAIAKKEREVGVDQFYEQTELSLSSGVKEGFYLPKSMLFKGERVLVADDLARTGRTIHVLMGLAKQAGALPVGLALIISTKEAVSGLSGIPTYVGHYVRDPR